MLDSCLFLIIGFCLFSSCQVIDEIYRVLRYVNATRAPQRAHEVLQELRDISSMAMEYFDEKIVPILKKKLPGADLSGRLIGSAPGSRSFYLFIPSFSLDFRWQMKTWLRSNLREGGNDGHTADQGYPNILQIGTDLLRGADHSGFICFNFSCRLIPLPSHLVWMFFWYYLLFNSWKTATVSTEN